MLIRKVLGLAVAMLFVAGSVWADHGHLIRRVDANGNGLPDISWRHTHPCEYDSTNLSYGNLSGDDKQKAIESHKKALEHTEGGSEDCNVDLGRNDVNEDDPETPVNEFAESVHRSDTDDYIVSSCKGKVHSHGLYKEHKHLEVDCSVHASVEFSGGDCNEGFSKDRYGRCIEDNTPQTPTPDPEPPTTSRSRSRSSSITSDMTPSTIERSLQIAVETQDDIPETISESTEEMEEEVVELVYHGTQWYKGYNLVSFPVLPSDIVTISDFYHRWTFFNSPQDFIMAKVDGCFLAYNGENNNAVGDLEITPYLGVVMLHDWSVYLGMHGVQVIGDGVLELEAGHHLVGLSEIPEGFTKPSDFLTIPHIDFVVTRTTATVVELPKWYSISREGDPGDEQPLYLGQAVLLIVSEPTEIVFRNDVAAAPQAHRTRTLTTSWGEMKR